MSDLILHRAATHAPHDHAIILPEPRHGGISIRVAELKDLAFIDALQKKHSRQVGFLFRDSLEKHIATGRVLIAQTPGTGAVGYVVASDKYLKREELGIVYQLVVLPGKQRGLVGATLVKEVFHRAAYGCRLFCCWCAQDLEANHFWESMGFLPIAFRTGSRTAGSKRTPRTHIYWQRRIREGDTETPYWFPSETQGGAIGEARLVLPLPPGTHWSDAKPSILPGMEGVNVLPPGAVDPNSKERRGGTRKALAGKAASAVTIRPPTTHQGGMWFAPPAPPAPPPPTKEQIAAAKKAAAEERKRNKERFKHDPKLVEAARELRDKYTEQINCGLQLPPSASGKYDVSRSLEAAPTYREAMRLGTTSPKMLAA